MSHRGLLALLLAVCAGWCGCGTTRVTDTTRSAAEELLISRSIDQTVGELNFAVLAGQVVYLDTQHLGDVAYKGYLTSALRQHLLASGCRLASAPEQAQVVVEARAGSIATCRHDMLVGVPRTAIPLQLTGVTPVIPELALLKKTTQIGVAKVSVFAYRVEDGSGVWQSGVHQNENINRNCWIFGLGPHQTGDIVLADRRNHLHNCLHWMNRARPREFGPLEFEALFTDLPDAPCEYWEPAGITPFMPPSLNVPKLAPPVVPPATQTPGTARLPDFEEEEWEYSLEQ